MKIKTTKGQRTKLLQCHSGVGFIAYKYDDGTVHEVEFFADSEGTLRYIHNGTLLRLEFLDDYNSLQVIQIVPPLAPNALLRIQQANNCLVEGLTQYPIGSQEASDCYNRAATLLKRALERTES